MVEFLYPDMVDAHKTPFIGVLNPLVETDTAVPDTDTIVFPATDVSHWKSFTIYIKNTAGGSGDDFLDVWAESSPDGTNWVNLAANECLIETEANTLAADEVGIAIMSGLASVGYIRLKAKCAGGQDTTATCWLCGSR